MAKKKKGRPKKVSVKGSKPHRQRGGWVKGYFRDRRKKANRNKPHKRNKRRNKETISKKGTRKQERRKTSAGYQIKQLKKMNRPKSKIKNASNSKQSTFGKPRGPPKIK